MKNIICIVRTKLPGAAGKKIKYALFIILIFIFGCSGSTPEIGQLIWQVNFKKGAVGEKVTPSLSFFILISDEDGIADINSVYLINDDAELFWMLDKESWNIKVLGGNNWIGTNSVRMNDGTAIPPGTYRIIAIDKAGERDTREFNISGEMLVFSRERSFPELSINSEVSVISEYSDNTLWIYNENLEVLKSINILNGRISMDIINNDTSGKARWITLYSFDPGKGTGYIRGPYSVNAGK